MGIFGDWAEKYYDNGLYVLPCGVSKDKAPPFYDWTKYCETPPGAQLRMEWINQFKDAKQIGLLLGKSTGVVAFDFDYDYNEHKCKTNAVLFEADRKRIEKEIMELLPDTPYGKVGAKGWTRFYKWNETLVNKNCNRNGVRLFDFLSTGRQTIIPPSIHSERGDKKIIYRWIDEELVDVNNLPDLSMDVIETIVSLYSDRPKGVRPHLKDLSRHERVMYHIIDLLRVDDNLERVAKSAVTYDLKINQSEFGQTPYLSDLKHHKSKDAEKNAVQFVTKLYKWATKKKILADSKEEKKELQKVEPQAWDHFFKISFNEVKKDIFSRDTFVRNKPTDAWQNIKAHENILKSYARRMQMPKTHVPEELDRWTFENQELEFLCNIPEWDGVDRVKTFAYCVESDRFSFDEICEILKQWGVNIFRRVENPENQNRAIIFKGPQGIGKDYLVRAMLRDFKPYFDTTTLPGTQKDALEIVSRLLVVHIEEFDQTKGLDVAFIKSLITQPAAFFREAYGMSPSQKLMRPSFISTANVDDILRDPTGNRRFIVVPVQKIKWQYPEDQSLQVVAQFKALSLNGVYRLSPELEKKIADLLAEYTPEDISETIVELYRAKVRRLLHGDYTADGLPIDGPFRGKKYLTYAEASPCIADIAKQTQCSLRRIQSVLKTKKYTHRFRDGIRCFLTPEECINMVTGVNEP